MTFIGVIIEAKKGKYLKKLLQEKLNEKFFSVIVVNQANIQNMKNIKFETILIAGDISILQEERSTLKNILQNAKNIVINTDFQNNYKLIENLESAVITYGFNSKATITTSSVENETMLLCIQRGIEDNKSNIIEPQEMKVNLNKTIGQIETTNLMGIITIFILYAIPF